MITGKFNRMLESFECDFSLAVKGDHTLSELDKRIKAGDKNLLHDIKLLEELSWLLRNNKAEIYLVDEQASATDTDIGDKWIPCNEKLPRRGTEVLTCRKGMAMPILVDAYEGWYGEDDDEWYEGWRYGKESVIAWMSLPPVFKGE